MLATKPSKPGDDGYQHECQPLLSQRPSDDESNLEGCSNNCRKSSHSAVPLLEAVQLVLLSCAWLAASSSTVLVNRHIIVGLGFKYPITLSFLGPAVSSIVSFFVVDVLKLAHSSEDVQPRYLFTRVIPIGIAQGICYWISNHLYLLLTVAFIEMARAMMPLVTLLSLWGAGVEMPTQFQILATSITGVGCAISAYGQVALSPLGVLLLVANFATEAVRLVVLQFLMKTCKLGVWQGIKLFALPCAAVLFCMAALLEVPDIVNLGGVNIIIDHPWSFIAAGCLGLTVNILGNSIIQVSSATTVKLLGAVRGPLVVVSGIMLFAEVVAPIQVFGYGLALLGFVGYAIAPKSVPPPQIMMVQINRHGIITK